MKITPADRELNQLKIVKINIDKKPEKSALKNNKNTKRQFPSASALCTPYLEISIISIF